jgi:hypothetical protein
MQTDLRRHVDLLRELDVLYPLKNFEPDTPEQTIREHCAQRRLVDRLFAELKYQEEEQDQLSLHVLGTPEHV